MSIKSRTKEELLKTYKEMYAYCEQRQGVCSATKQSKRGRPSKETAERKAAIEDAIFIPKQEPRNEKTHIVYMTTVKSEGLIASDQTCMFPRASNRGNKYICIFYVYDSNFIKGMSIKSRTKEELLKTYKEMYAYCEQRGFKPQLHTLDNQLSKDSEVFITSQKRACNILHLTYA